MGALSSIPTTVRAVTRPAEPGMFPDGNIRFMEHLAQSLLDLIVETSTNLPPDVRRAMARAVETERPDSRSAQALDVIAANIDMASDCQGPICQDTGWPTFEVRTPIGTNQIRIEEAIPQRM